MKFNLQRAVLSIVQNIASCRLQALTCIAILFLLLRSKNRKDLLLKILAVPRFLGELQE